MIKLLFFNLRGGAANKIILGCRCTAERAGGGVGQKQTRKGEGSTAGRSLRGETLERQAKWPVKVRDSAQGKKDRLLASIKIKFSLHCVLFK